MTSGDTNSSGSGGTAVQTNGIGQHCDAHLNLTRSLADVWGVPDRLEPLRVTLEPEAPRPPAGRPPAARVERSKIPYAGTER